jgi:NADH:ubiquinone oxidoreductase subunit 5 (subunit L)/multisubunit Na+/H+ antiporter MnhA subunit
MLIASLSLVAILFMTGFYSKDFILESAYGQYQLSSIVVYFIATTGICEISFQIKSFGKERRERESRRSVSRRAKVHARFEWSS